MTFYSPVFLFAFLPAAAALYRSVRGSGLRRAIWILSGLVFYAFGDIRHVPLLLAVCALHYGVGRFLRAAERGRRPALFACVALDLAVLALYKIKGALPFGISVFTFQAISYVVDVYRNRESGTKDLLEVLQYLTFFPQLTAGPFAKFGALRPYFTQPELSWDDGARGIRRFVCGLTKKLVLCAAAAKLADAMFCLAGIDALGAWLGAIGYCLQLYFDFSGYSDMAIGLGLLFGVRLPENFNYPYLAGSVSEFWRSWHISLSSWFRDYLYIPLGGSRKGTARTVFNKLLVFLATGLWHGTGTTFILWGLWHGLFCSLETVFDRKKALSRHWYGHIYTLLVVSFGFVLFRAEGLAQAGTMLRAMLTGFAPVDACRLTLRNLLTAREVFLLLAGVFACLPVWPKVRGKLEGKRGMEVLLDGVSVAAFAVCAAQLASSSFQPFIYAGF